jgi:hypothetical protein
MLRHFLTFVISLAGVPKLSTGFSKAYLLGLRKGFDGLGEDFFLLSIPGYPAATSIMVSSSLAFNCASLS